MGGLLAPKIPQPKIIQSAPSPTIDTTDVGPSEEDQIQVMKERIKKENNRVGVSSLRIPLTAGSGTGLSIPNG